MCKNCGPEQDEVLQVAPATWPELWDEIAGLTEATAEFQRIFGTAPGPGMAPGTVMVLLAAAVFKAQHDRWPERRELEVLFGKVLHFAEVPE